MRRRRRLGAFLLVVILAAALRPNAAVAQQPPRYTYAVRAIALEVALDDFVRATRLALSYDPDLIAGRQSSCVVTEATAEILLQCILRESGLDFIRRSSGTYVLAEPSELAPARGSLRGVVHDGPTGAPLAAAHVYLPTLHQGTITDAQGRFVFAPVLTGAYDLQVSHLGYEPEVQRITVSPSAEVTAAVGLTPSVLTITPLIVDGLQARAPAIGLAAPPSDQTPGRTALQALLPEIQVHPATYEPHVQGSDAGAQAWTLDGADLYLPRLLSDFMAPLSAMALQQVTIHRAGFGAGGGSHTGAVLAASHLLRPERRAAARLDPAAASLRLATPLLGWETVGTAEVGLWDLTQPDALVDQLQSWSVPDLYLLTAPLLAGNPAVVQPVLPLDQARAPGHRAFNGHLTAQRRFDPLRTLQVSAFLGDRQVARSLLPLFAPGAPRNAALMREADVHQLLAVEDAYRWRTGMLQARYATVLNAHTFVQLQAFASRYAMDHHYQLLDSVTVRQADSRLLLERALLSPARDENRMQTFALQAGLDHAAGRHHLEAGLRGSLDQSRFDLEAVNLGDVELVSSPDAQDGFQSAAARRFGARYGRDHIRLSAFAQDQWTLSATWSLTLGTRLTYLPERATVYGEPRVAARMDLALPGGRRLAAQTSAGVYRQFVNQFDVSKLNAGALLPSVRIWLPAGGDVRPPRSLHLAQELSLVLSPGLTLQAEAFYKHEAHMLVVRYRPATAPPPPSPPTTQDALLGPASGRTLGAGLALRGHWRHMRFHLRYDRSDARRRDPRRFGGRQVVVPWSVPHHLQGRLDVLPHSRWAVYLQGQGLWGRRWGLQQAYYDYLAEDPATRNAGDFDLAHPERHTLPALLRVDAGVRYSISVGRAQLDVLAEVLNLTDRVNVADYRLVMSNEQPIASPRVLIRRWPRLAVSLHF